MRDKERTSGQGAQPPFHLWPASHLLITADTSESVSGLLHPRHQLRFFDEMASFAGPDLFAGALAYSIPHGNTGWTALRMGKLGHMTYHQWDSARPNLLQLDVLGTGAIDEKRAVETVRDFWIPLGMRVMLIRRPEPAHKLSVNILQDDLTPRTGLQEGLGPGEHLHLFVDQIGTRRVSLSRQFLDDALIELVGLLKMRPLTAVMSNEQYSGSDTFAYDAIVGITTSHLSLRVRQERGLTAVSLDAFSCRNFNAKMALNWLRGILDHPANHRAILYVRYPTGKLVEV